LGFGYFVGNIKIDYACIYCLTRFMNASNSATPLVNRLATQVVNGLLAVKPLAAFAKNRARNLIIKRAESIGVAWRSDVKTLKARDTGKNFDPAWEQELAELTNPQTKYPDYYLTSFHAYTAGNMGWEPAMEVEVAAYSVHAKIFAETGKNGDQQLRQSYHQALQKHIPNAPEKIVDIGCSVGMSTVAMQAAYPAAQITGVDLSPYFLAVANYRHPDKNIQWVHAAAEQTNLPAASYDLVSLFLICHELPQTATLEIFREARRLLKSGGQIAIMDMNPASAVYSQMPPYILTLLKSTEPYLDQYFSLDIDLALQNTGFESIQIIANSPRHRTVIATARE
jgi:ubiquinone/menaquinone biosynthesis C-methylase UbiE